MESLKWGDRFKMIKGEGGNRVIWNTTGGLRGKLKEDKVKEDRVKMNITMGDRGGIELRGPGGGVE